ATTNARGAGKWQPELAEHFDGADVVVIPDNDQPGREHAEQVARALQGKAASVRIVELPGLGDKEDIVEWIDAGHTREELDLLVDRAPEAKRAAIPATTATAGEAAFEDVSKDGIPKASCANARIAIMALGIECRYDLFHDKLLVGGHAIAQHAGELSDHACQMLRLAIHAAWKF